MALFSDELFNVFEEEADPSSSKSKKRRREGKDTRNEASKETEKPKKLKLEEGETAAESGGVKEASDHVIGGPREADGDALDELQEEYVRRAGQALYLVPGS